MELFRVKGSDFGPLREFNLELKKQGLVWIGGQNEDTKAAKSNGAGKSSVFKALTWCLWGETIDKEVGDKVIREGATEAVVTTVLEGGWEVERTRRKGSPRLQLRQPDGKVWAAAGKDVQEKINALVGLDFKSFKNTVLYGQNDSLRFANPATRDSDRKEMLHRILRTELLKGCHEWIRGEAKKKKTEIDDIQKERVVNEAALAEQDLAGLEADTKEWERDKRERVDALKKRVQAFAASAKECTEKTVDTAAIDGKIAGLQETVDKADAAERTRALLRQKRDVLAEKRAKLRVEAGKLEQVVEQYDERLAQLDGDVCPVCSSPLTKGEGHEHKKKLIVERETASAKGEKVVEQCRAVEPELKKLDEAIAREEENIKKASVASRRISELKSEREAATKMEMEAERFKEKAREALDQAKVVASQENPFASRLDGARERTSQLTDTLNRIRAREKQAGYELAHIEFWVRGFSGQGLPSFVLDSVMPFITERANHYLETLSDGDIKVSFDTQRELKSSKGEYRDEISISWEIEGIEDYPASGGQLKKIEIATDLALMDLVATRESRIDLLMLDEVLDGLDDEGRARVLRLLHELRAKRGSIFVISHEAEMAEAFEKAIIVTKRDGASTLEAL
jgi:DNA repair exonuclease SbcCD ATPase subunit